MVVKPFISACILHEVYLNGSAGNLSSPGYPNVTSNPKTNYTWVISVQEGYQVQLTVYDLVGSWRWLTIHDGMFQASPHIGDFINGGSGLKPWSVFASGRRLWVNFNGCFPRVFFKLQASFKATKFNESKSFHECTCRDRRGKEAGREKDE